MRILCALAVHLLAVAASAAEVSGRVVLVEGWPLPGATITSDSGQTVVSDAEGRFTLDVPEGRSVRVKATLAGFVPGEAVLCTASDRDVLPELTLSMDGIDCCMATPGLPPPDVGPFQWEVTDLRDRPLAASPITISDRQGQLLLSGATDDHGRFEVRSLRPGAYRIDIAAPGFAAKSMLMRVSACAAVNADFRIRMAESCE